MASASAFLLQGNAALAQDDITTQGSSPHQQGEQEQNWIFANARQSAIRRLAKRSLGAISWSLIDRATIEEVADYTTMRMLLLVDPYMESRETPLPSILALFSEGSANGEGLTEMDRAILRATYKSRPNDTTYSTSRETARNLIESELSALGTSEEQ